jgi:hypothetical protein
MEGLISELLRLERAKHEALVSIDAAAYEARVREQMELLSASKDSLVDAPDIEQLLALSQLITLNSRLLQNLLSTTPLFQLSRTYTETGSPTLAAAQRIFVEA